VNTQRWLARLSFSFFIIAAVLFWEIYKISEGARGTVAGWRIGLYLVGCMLAITMGILGVRARHRSEQ
jgi:cytochrome c oxidase assembly factor CtaG